MATSINIHSVDSVSASTIACKGIEGRGPFTTITIQVINADDTKFNVVLFGLSDEHCNLLASAINAVRAPVLDEVA